MLFLVLTLSSSCLLFVSVEMAEETKTAAFIPESVLKKRKRSEDWALLKVQELKAKKEKSAENRKIIFKRAEKYGKEYREQVTYKTSCVTEVVCLLTVL